LPAPGSERLGRLLCWLAPLGAAVFALVCVAGRVEGALTSYGTGRSAAFGPHTVRLDVLRVLQDAAAGRSSLLAVPWAIDGEYPPLTHVVTGLLVAPFGHSLDAAVLSGFVWVVLLALAVAGVAGRLGTGRFDAVAASAGATGILLLASFQAQAVRYYYDLPMTALLWVAVAVVLLGWDARPRLAAVGGGVLFALAGLAKWTTVPFGGLMGVGLLALAALSGTRRPRRLRVAAGSGVVAVVVAALYVVPGIVWTSTSSFLSQISTAGWAEEPAAMASWPRIWFYPDGIVHAVLSPALALVLGGLLVVWLVRSRRGGALVGLVVVGQLGWLTLAMPTQDERFALTAVPALLVAGALGFAQMGRSARWILAPLTVVIAVVVGWDAHFGVRADAGERRRGLRIETVSDLGLDSTTWPDAAWTRGDEPGRDCRGYREQIVDLVQRCGAHVIGIAEEDTPIVSEERWWEYVVAHDAARRELGKRSGLIVHRRYQLKDVPDATLDLVLTSFSADGVTTPDGVDPAAFRLAEQVDAADCPETGGVVAWRPVELPDCQVRAGSAGAPPPR